MEMIDREGSGIIVIINRPVGDMFTDALRVKSGEVSVAEMEALRDYGVGASILTELGVREMILLTNTHHTMIGLDGYGLTVVEERPID